MNFNIARINTALIGEYALILLIFFMFQSMLKRILMRKK